MLFFILTTDHLWNNYYVLVQLTPSQHALTLCLLVPSAGNLCKQFGPRSGPTDCWAWSGSKLFDSLMVFLKCFFFEKVDFEKKIQQTTKTQKKYIVGKELINL